MAVNNS